MDHSALLNTGDGDVCNAHHFQTMKDVIVDQGLSRGFLIARFEPDIPYVSWQTRN